MLQTHMRSVLIPLKIPSAIKEVLCTPAYLRHLIVPYLLGSLSFILCFILLWLNADTITSLLPSFSISWLPDLIEPYISSTLSILSGFFIFIACIFLSAIISLLAVSLLAGFFIESFIERVLVDRGLLKTQDKKGKWEWLRSFIRILADEAVKIILLALLALMLFILGFIPGGALVVFVLAAFVFGFEIFDLPLILLELRFKDRWALVKKHKMETFILGASFTLLCLIPFAGLFFMPVAYLLAVDQIKKWEL